MFKKFTYKKLNRSGQVRYWSLTSLTLNIIQMIRDNHCRIDYEINTIAIEQATSSLRARYGEKRRRRPAARLPIDRHTGIYRRCGGERADSVDEH